MWRIIFSKTARRQLAKLPQALQTEITASLQNETWMHLPRRTGGSWFAIPAILPVRVGAYRILCKISSTEDVVDIEDIRYEPR